MKDAEHDTREAIDAAEHRRIELESYSFVRRVLFPYNGMELLTMTQSLRLILAWIAFFFPGMLILTLIVALAAHATVLKVLIALGFALLIDVVAFGGTAWLTIAVNNRAVRMQRARRRLQGQQSQGMMTNRGGRYGS